MTDLLKSEQYIKQHRDETIKTMCRFAATDMLLFWSNETEILKRQQEIWRPYLDELNVKINISQSLQIPENEIFLQRINSYLEKLSDKKLTAAFLTATLLKSVILGIFILNDEISVEQLFAAAFLEELYQNELWGTDNEAAEKRETVKSELHKIKEYLYK